MTIYSRVNSNKIRTYLIVAVFIFLATGFFYLIGQYFQSPGTYLVFGLVFSLASGLISYFYSDKIVLFTVGAKPASKRQYFDFYTVTENLSIAYGLPMPKLYVIDDLSMNAFATGRDPKHAIVCATTSLLDRLDRSELEGVIAHELSHVKNYDILLASIVAVLVGTVAFVANWLTRSMWWGQAREREDENRNPLLFIFFIIVLIISPIVATIIQLTISRRREYLADASGALLTRYPKGLARALEKISAQTIPLSTASPATAHLFIVNPFKNKRLSSWLINLFSTHPPIEDRIKILRSM